MEVSLAGEPYSEISGILELGNVWVFVQLIHRPMRTKNQLYKTQTLPNSWIPDTSAHHRHHKVTVTVSEFVWSVVHGARGGVSVSVCQQNGDQCGQPPEVVKSLKLIKVWVFVQLIRRLRWTENQLYKNLNIP